MTLYMALVLAIVDGFAVEPVGDTGYTRQPFIGAVAGGVVTVSSGVTFGPARQPLGPFDLVAIFDAATNGDFLGYISTPSILMPAGACVSIGPGIYGISAPPTLDPAVLTVAGVPLTFAGQPLRMM